LASVLKRYLFMRRVQKMKMKNNLFAIVFATLLVVMIIGGVSYFYIVRFTSKTEELETIYAFIIALSVSLIGTSKSIKSNFYSKDKDKDERNNSIENKAKAKAFDVMGVIFGILMIIYVVIKCNLLTISLVVIVYLTIYAVYMIYFGKYHKEM